MFERSPLGAAYHFLKDEVLYGTLLYRYGVERHRMLQQHATRCTHHTYTCFRRSPGQLEALVGPVLKWLAPTKLNILVFASSTGAEPYTIASVLARHAPTLDFHITASDLHAEMVDVANTAVYSARDVLRRAPPARFIADTFDRHGDGYRVRSEIRSRVTVKRADLLDPHVVEQFEPADIVFAQNVFCHLTPGHTRIAFHHVMRLACPRAVLFIDGMNLDLREELTAQRGLVPLDFKVREIHAAARGHIGDRWWNYYYGLEPYARWHPSSARRYSTIFLHGT
jgi:chemotaxis methyl-accepting protein methylase